MMSSTISIFTRPSSDCSPAINPTTPIRMITTPTTPAYVLAMFFRPPCKDRSSTQVPAATAEKLPDSLTFLPYLLSDGPLRHLEADLRMGAVAKRLRRLPRNDTAQSSRAQSGTRCPRHQRQPDPSPGTVRQGRQSSLVQPKSSMSP